MSKEFQNLCPGCFEVKGRQPICGHCGYDESARRGPLVLPHRILLRNQYLIGRVLGKPGGFGITYLAFDTGLETRVAIKEYLPRDLAGRESGELTVSAHSDEDGELFRFGLEQFIQEARTLAKFDHAHLVGVHSVFEENGTAYLVMDYYEGMTLAEYLDKQGGKVSEKTAIDIMMPIIDGLREVHEKGFIHRDIKPQNIYLTTQGRAILLDFGAARLAMAERSKSLSVVLTPGYAPFEQYRRRGEQGPWTDVYACAAVLYRMVTGIAPPEAPDRVDEDLLEHPSKFVPALSPFIAEAIVKGLSVKTKNRPPSIKDFRNLLVNKAIAPSKPYQAAVAPCNRQVEVRGKWEEIADFFLSRQAVFVALGLLAVAAFWMAQSRLVDRLSAQPPNQTPPAITKNGSTLPKPEDQSGVSDTDPKNNSQDDAAKIAKENHNRIEKLMESARKNMAANHISGPSEALENYEAVLNIDPDYSAAREELREVREKLLKLADEAKQKGDATTAEKHWKNAKRAEAALSRGLELVEKRKEIEQLKQKQKEEQEAARRAEAQRRAEVEAAKRAETKRKAEEEAAEARQKAEANQKAQEAARKLEAERKAEETVPGKKVEGPAYKIETSKKVEGPAYKIETSKKKEEPAPKPDDAIWSTGTDGKGKGYEAGGKK